MLWRFGSRTFVPLSWMCKKQTSVSYNSTESDVLSSEASLRMDGSPALDLWCLVFKVLHPSLNQPVQGNLCDNNQSRERTNTRTKKHSYRDDLNLIKTFTKATMTTVQHQVLRIVRNLIMLRGAVSSLVGFYDLCIGWSLQRARKRRKNLLVWYSVKFFHVGLRVSWFVHAHLVLIVYRSVIVFLNGNQVISSSLIFCFRAVIYFFCNLLWRFLDQVGDQFVDLFGDFWDLFHQAGDEKCFCVSLLVRDWGSSSWPDICKSIRWLCQSLDFSFGTKLHLQQWPPCPVRLPACCRTK